jgi:ABC-type Fe3+ transport system substrate-binding protein
MKFSSILLFGAALATATVADAKLKEETKTLDQLHADAIAEGGNLVLYHGGDIPTQQDSLHQAFAAAYPDINFTLIVDYSKYHDVRIDNQLETDTLVPDIVALQTLQDFTRWEKEDKLLKYKPAGFSQIYDKFKSSSGAWMSHVLFKFTSFFDAAGLEAAGLDVPKTIEDLVDPQYAGHIASGYPHDDDAILFVYTRYVEKYGWEWVSKLANQSVEFQRGSNTPGEAVGSGSKLIGLAATPAPNSISLAGNGTEYLSWGQRIAILKKAAHPAAAKLFMNWVVSKETQSTLYAGMSMSTRKDVANADGSKHAWEIEEANSNVFPTFMEDRASLERWKQTFALYFGEVQGEPGPGFLGVYPGRA